MARQKKPPKVLWVCPDCGPMPNTDGSRTYAAETRRTGVLLDCPGCFRQSDCPGPVKYERKDSE